MSVEYTLISPPEAEPVTLAQARRHARVFVEDADEDAYLTTLVAAARELTEKACVTSWSSQVLRATFDAFPGGGDPIKLFYGPATSIDSITYGADDAELSDESYTLVGDMVKPVDKWPSTSGPVKVTFQAGADDVDDVPQRAKLAILFLVAGWYEHRMPVSSTTMSEVPLTVRSLLGSLWKGIYP
jgi:uncharacterized phiE125 gp8 family phage protein